TSHPTQLYTLSLHDTLPILQFPTSGVYVSMPVDSHPMESYQYNVSYQREVARGWLLDATYTGNQQRHIWIGGYAENPAVNIPGRSEEHTSELQSRGHLVCRL